jgi:hypothetical protein
MSADKKEKSGAANILATLQAQNLVVDEINRKLEKLAEESKVRYIDLCCKHDDLEAKVAAIASGRKTTTTRVKKDPADAASTPVGSKTYPNSLGFLKGEFNNRREEFRALFSEEALADCDEHMETVTKKGDARDKHEANYLWVNYAKKNKEDDADTESSKSKIRDAIKHALDEYKTQSSTPTTAGKKE